jgi:hypothetical protein
MQGIQGVKKIKDGYNPATWMLEVTTLSQEDALGVNFAEVYMNSDLYRYVQSQNDVSAFSILLSHFTDSNVSWQEEQSSDQ